MPNASIQQVLSALAARAVTDAPFRTRLIANPHRAAREAGIELPAGARVRFDERPAGVDHVVVLPELAEVGQPLTEDELESVAGGGTTQDCGNCTMCTGGLYDV